MLTGLVLGPLALLTTFDHSTLLLLLDNNKAFRYLLDLLIGVSCVTLLNYWLVRKRQFAILATPKEKGPEHFTLMLYGVSHNKTHKSIASTYLRSQPGRLHRPMQASGFLSTIKAYVNMKREQHRTAMAIKSFGE